MKYIFSIFALVFFTTAVFPQLNETSANRKIKIGDFLNGGIVFFVDETGNHGLICAVKDQSSSAIWNKQKKVRRNERLSENFSTTTTIFGTKSQRKLNRNNYNANKLCSKLKVEAGGEIYKNWFLPSKENLELMYLNKNKINESALNNGGEKFIDSYYWSSTEFDYSNAYVHSFADGKKAYHFKNYSYGVRAISTF